MAWTAAFLFAARPADEMAWTLFREAVLNITVSPLIRLPSCGLRDVVYGVGGTLRRKPFGH